MNRKHVLPQKIAWLVAPETAGWPNSKTTQLADPVTFLAEIHLRPFGNRHASHDS